MWLSLACLWGGVTGSPLITGQHRCQWGTLHFVSRTQETGKQNVLLDSVLPKPPSAPAAESGYTFTCDTAAAEVQVWTSECGRPDLWADLSDQIWWSSASQALNCSTAYPTGHNLNSAVVNSEPTCLSKSVSSFIYFSPQSVNCPQFINGGSQFDVKDGHLR